VNQHFALLFIPLCSDTKYALQKARYYDPEKRKKKKKEKKKKKKKLSLNKPNHLLEKATCWSI
jgi:hypothetical protein